MVLWQSLIHDVPWPGIRYESIHLGFELTGILQAGGKNTDKSFVRIFPHGQTRTAGDSKTAQVMPTGKTRSRKALNHTLCQFECIEWNQDGWSIRSA